MSEETTAAFLRTLKRLENSLNQLDSKLQQSFGVLSQSDAQLSVQLSALMRVVSRELEAVKKSGESTIMQIEHLNGLAHTAALLNSSLDVTSVLDGVIDTIIRLTKAERAYLILLEDGQLKPWAARHWNNDEAPSKSNDVMYSTSIINQAIEDQTHILTVNAQDDPRFERVDSVNLGALRSVLCVPLISRDQVIGVVYADNRVMPGIFDEYTVELVTSFANQAAIAIENARLFERVTADLDKAQHALQYRQHEPEDSQPTDTNSE